MPSVQSYDNGEGGAFDIIRYPTGEWFDAFDQPDQVAEMQRQLMSRGIDPRQVVITPLENDSTVVEARTFGNREVVVGMTWATLEKAVHDTSWGRSDNSLDIVLDEGVDAAPGFMTLAALDARKLTETSGVPSRQLRWFHWPPSDAETPMRLWRPRPGLTLDVAAFALFVAEYSE